MSQSQNILKNTLFLYVRMFLIMGVSLYTSRVVLRVLGVEDFGVYNVVGGVVAMFGLFNSAMSAATQRFFAFEIGRNNYENLKNTFKASLTIHIIIAFFLAVLSETIGLWFINHKLNVDHSKIELVNYVYQFSILTFVIGIIQVPYNALMIAREKMNVYAIFSIVEVCLKLAIVFLLVKSPISKLISYSLLIFLVSLLIFTFYKFYCSIKFKESHYSFYYDKELYKRLTSYSGWALFGNVAVISRSQGNNILLNIFFGTVVNATYGIAIQVQSAVNLFVNNFQMAVNPQIIKTYAAGEIDRSKKLMMSSSKLAYFLMMVLILPLVYNTDFILKVWLYKVPPMTKDFVQLSLIGVLIDSLSGPMMVIIQAKGDIKWYQITIGIFMFLCLPLSYLFVYLGYPPSVVFKVIIGVNLVCLFLRLFFLNKMISIGIIEFVKNVILNICIVTFLVLIIYTYTIGLFVTNNMTTNFIISCLLLTSLSLVLIIVLGLHKSEKQILRKIIYKFKK